MSGQSNAAAERSAHVERDTGEKYVLQAHPVIEVRPGVYQLRCLVEVEQKLEEARDEIARLNKLRPLWAMGYSDDSIAAQMNASALVALWDMLGVKNQTAAVAKLKELLAR